MSESSSSEIRVIERSDSVRQRVHDEILRLVVRGTLPPGSNITERKLSSQLGVSRTPVREALVSLEQDGLIYTDPIRGFFVQRLTLAEVEETYPILWTLEQLALKATGNLSDSLLLDLRALNNEMARPNLDPEEGIDLDNRWHRALVSECGNDRLINLITRTKRAIRRYEFAYMREEGLGGKSVQQHEEIIAALARKDLPSALDALEENFKVSLRFFARQLESSATERDQG